MELEIMRFSPIHDSEWDDFCQVSRQGTFLHTRKFLNYHQNRFEDQSLVILKNGRWVGLLPAAISSNDETTVCSHPGSSYGGILHQGELIGLQMVIALDLIFKFYASLGFNEMIYKATPNIYHKIVAEDDLYALFRLGALNYRCDLSSSINLSRPAVPSHRRSRGLKRARNNGVSIGNDITRLPEFWHILSANLHEKFGATPTHSLIEIEGLISTFPNNISIIYAEISGKLIAGTILFITDTCVHAQYIGSSELGKKLGGLDLVFSSAINFSRDINKSWFDFGISNEKNGLYLNDGLYTFKSEFGGGGSVQKFYKKDLLL